jgi:hypothetical protein
MSYLTISIGNKDDFNVTCRSATSTSNITRYTTLNLELITNGKAKAVVNVLNHNFPP